VSPGLLKLGVGQRHASLAPNRLGARLSQVAANIAASGLLVTDKMRDHDEAFVYETWLRGFQNSPRGLRTDDYWASQRAVIDALLGQSEVLVMRPGDWAEGIVGWICAERRSSTHAVHAFFTKRDFRRMGVAKTLLAQSRGEEVFANLVYTHLRPPHTRWLERIGYHYDRGQLGLKRKTR
jgi:hypothetical protein